MGRHGRALQIPNTLLGPRGVAVGLHQSGSEFERLSLQSGFGCVREPTESASEPAPVQGPTESAPVREATESATEPAPAREPTESAHKAHEAAAVSAPSPPALPAPP